MIKKFVFPITIELKNQKLILCYELQYKQKDDYLKKP